ncbi:MAG: aspartate/glutamate racemase family protein [Woeseiaceae bacterium]
MKKKILALDPIKREPVVREMTTDERPSYYFGEDIGLLVFQPWYYCIPTMGHISYAKTYDFPVRIKFVDDPFDPIGFHESDARNKGWNLDAWIESARELEEEGVRAIVGGCGLTGMIQKEIAAAVEIPVYMSSMLFVPEVYETVAGGKRVGVMTVSSEQLQAHDKALFAGCDIDESIPVAIVGMNESTEAEAWASQVTPEFERGIVESAIVNVAQKLNQDNPDLGAIVLECTEMPSYANAIRDATGLPVFDALDMVNRVQKSVS